MLRRWSNSRNVLENDELQAQSKVKELRDALGPLSGRCLKYCGDACLRRYLDARNWNVDKSKKMLEETLKWRATYKPEEIHWHEVAVEGETGKLFKANFHDRSGRTVLIMRPGKQNTTSLDNQIRHLVYLMENAILNLPEGQEQMAWLIDFTGWTLSTSVPIKSARETVNILQNQYPERLAVAFLYSPPRIFETFWKVVKYFLDPKTIQKVKFVYPMKQDSVELMSSYFDVDNLPTEFGGKATLQYDHEEFSKLMIADDEKTANFWGFSDKFKTCSNDHTGGAEVAPEPTSKSQNMVNPFMCGSGSFSHQLEKEDEDENNKCSTPRKISPKKSRKSSLSRIRDEKNPYAKRGLDKFSALLAEVEDTKQKIYTQIPSDDISLVRFTYSDTDRIKPIVVRVRDKKQENKIENTDKGENTTVVESSMISIDEAKRGVKNDLKNSFPFKKIKIELSKPSFYLAAILIWTLVFLALSGRSFAILCTSIGWYLVPSIKKWSLSAKRRNKKKEYARRASDKKIMTVNDWLYSPKTVLTGAPVDDVSPPRKGFHQKRW